MSATSCPYQVQVHAPEIIGDRNDGWTDIINDRLEFCRGFYHARRDSDAPHRAYRIVRVADGRVLESCPARTEAGVGMVAGYPTGAQYIGAAVRLLERCRPHGEYVTAEDADRAARALKALVVHEQ